MFATLLACSTPEVSEEEPTETEETEETASDEQGDDEESEAPVDTGQLSGEWRKDGGEPPLFAVQNHEDVTRTKKDLPGSITVMWFYPAASTYG